MAWRFFPILPGQIGGSRHFRIGADLLEGAKREVLDNSPPPELQ
jgi:hypothetical protein